MPLGKYVFTEEMKDGFVLKKTHKIIMENEISDLKAIAEMKNSDIEQLLIDAFNRGVRAGIEIAKEKAIEAIKNEK